MNRNYVIDFTSESDPDLAPAADMASIKKEAGKSLKDLILQQYSCYIKEVVFIALRLVLGFDYFYFLEFHRDSFFGINFFGNSFT